jgi:polysaccharide export outer membrane protein
MRKAFIIVAMSLAIEPPSTLLGQHTALPVYPGDVIELRMQSEPDMSGEYSVSPLGVAVFPRLGEIQASKYTAETLQALLVEQYRRYLQDPSIDVIVRRRVRIGGAVRNRGYFNLDPDMTMWETLAIAGGPSPQGQDEVWVFRDGKIITTILGGPTLIEDSPIQSGDRLFVTWASAVPERGWISRNANALGAVLGGAAAVTIALIR